MDLYAEDENYRRAVSEHLVGVICIHCDSVNELLSVANGRRVLSMHHEPGCPLHEDFGDDSAA